MRLTPLKRAIRLRTALFSAIRWSTSRLIVNTGVATIAISGPDKDASTSVAALRAEGAETYLLRLARELDDAVLQLRLNELEMGVVVFKTEGDAARLVAHDKLIAAHVGDDWFAAKSSFTGSGCSSASPHVALAGRLG